MPRIEKHPKRGSPFTSLCQAPHEKAQKKVQWKMLQVNSRNFSTLSFKYAEPTSARVGRAHRQQRNQTRPSDGCLLDPLFEQVLLVNVALSLLILCVCNCNMCNYVCGLKSCTKPTISSPRYLGARATLQEYKEKEPCKLWEHGHIFQATSPSPDPPYCFHPSSV